MTFVHFSVRSDMSATSSAPIGDFAGSAKIQEYVARAVELKAPALACTELGSLRGIYLLASECAKKDIKPIFGCEVYVCGDHKKGAIPKELQDQITKGLPPSEWRDALDAYAIEHGYMQGDRELTTLNLWALDDQGLKNLIALTSIAWIDGYYYKPRVDMKLIRLYSEGLACGTAGPRSYVNRPLIEGKRSVALERARELSSIFADRFYAEIQPHPLMINGKANSFAIELESMGLAKLLATGYVHYVNQGDLPNQKMLAAIGRNGTYELPSQGLEIDSYWMRSHNEMLQCLMIVGAPGQVAERACDETLKLAERCTAKLAIDPFAMIIPHIDTGELSHVEYLRKLCWESLKWDKLLVTAETELLEKTEAWHTSNSNQSLAEYLLMTEQEYAAYVENSRHYKDVVLKWYQARLAHELEQLGRPVAPGNPATFASYIVYVYEVCQMARSLGATLGPGRGSAAGSLVNHLIGITNIDPIEHNLLFSRFIDPNRVGPPDIDIDIDPSKLPALFEAMQNRWGRDCVAKISNFLKAKGRMVFADVCRELRIKAPGISRHIDQRSDHDDRPFDTIYDAFIGNEESPVVADCLSFANENPDVIKYALSLEGKLRGLGVHAAGIVASPRPLMEFTPLETRDEKDGNGRVIVTAFDMVGIDQVGLLKIDMLKLTTINQIDKAIEAIRKHHGDVISWDSIPLDDKATLDAFTAGDLTGVFQFDSSSARRLCKNVKFTSFGIIADMTALNRPGPLDSKMAEQYINRMNDPSLVKTDYCSLVSEITKDTFGIMVYQEQVMQVCEKVGLHKNPDVMRKIIGKKLADKIEAERAGFIEGASKSAPEMSNDVANKLYDDIVKFGRYGFNRSHSAAYAKLSYIQQYLKVHYPLEFYWALIITSKDEDKRHVAKDAAARGIVVAPPSVQLSGYELAIDYENNAIVGAISDITGVGEKAAKSIVENQPFSSFADFMARVNRRAVNAGTIKSLALAGALDKLLPNVKWFIDNADELFHKSKLKKFAGWDAELAKAAGDDYTESDKLYNAMTVNPMALDSPYNELLESLSINIEDHTAEDFMDNFDDRGVWITGTLVDVKLYQQKKWDDSKPSEAEAAHESYGAQYASALLEAENGKQTKVKIPWWVYKEHEECIDEDEPVLLLAVPNARYNSISVRLVLSLEFLRAGWVDDWRFKIINDSPLPDKLTEYERKIGAKDYSKLKAKLFDGDFDVLPLIGTVVDIQTQISGKKEQEMAKVGIVTSDGEYTQVTIWASNWAGGWDPKKRKKVSGCKGKFNLGSFLVIDVASNEYRGQKSCVYQGGELRVL